MSRKLHTEEQKQYLSIINSGVGNPFFGKRHSDESKEKMRISTLLTPDKHQPILLTLKENEVLNGLLLSDIHLEKRDRNARITLGVKYLEFAESIVSSLLNISWPSIKEYKNCYWIKSRVNSTITDLHNKWYDGRKKVVPRDLVLTPETCYWWYLGDGSVSDYSLKLSTQGFTLDEINFLTYLLDKEGFKSTIRSSNIFIKSRYVEEFIKYIGPCRIDCYSYKWNIRQRKENFRWVK